MASGEMGKGGHSCSLCSGTRGQEILSLLIQKQAPATGLRSSGDHSTELGLMQKEASTGPRPVEQSRNALPPDLV